MGAKATKVLLEVEGQIMTFDFAHAERLLKITKAGWHLPENSKFEFVENVLRYKANKRGNRKA